MRRTFTFRFRLIPLVFVLGVSALVCGQSLGDVARENREKKAASTSSPQRVITNTDLGVDPDGEQPADTPSPPAANPGAGRKAAEQRAAEQRAAEHWKQQILTQKRVIADLQARTDALRASIQFVDPNAYSNGYIYNRFQARQVERLKVLEAQLVEQKQKLEDMQEAARHAGMHTPVYDP